jgi:hypothetical protein
MSLERVLLQRCLDEFEYKGVACNELCIDINKLLAQPESLREDLREDLREEISLRDHFAGLAMQSLLTKTSTTVGSDSVAMAAYHVAHQMLKERSRGVSNEL